MNFAARNHSPSEVSASDSQDETLRSSKGGPFGLFNRDKGHKRSSLIRAWHRRNEIGETDTQNVDKNLQSKLALRVTVQQARQLAIDETLNPYCTIGFAGQNEQTHAAKKTVNPDWSTTFEFNLFPECKQNQQLLWNDGVTAKVYSKSHFKSTLVGQYQWPFENLFDDTPIAYDEKSNEAKWYPLQTPNKSRRSRLGLQGKAPAEDLSCAQSEVQIKFGLVLLGEEASVEQVHQAWSSLFTTTSEDSANLPSELESLKVGDTRNKSGLTPVQNSNTAPESKQLRSERNLRRQPKKQVPLSKSDMVGVTFLEISRANNLPPERNVTHTGFDMDPFVIVSFGSSTYRTDHIRHCLDPVWNEQIHFSVHQPELKYKLKFSVYDKDKFSSNDFVASQEVPIQDIIDSSKNTEISGETFDADMEHRTVPLVLANKDKWKDLNTTLTFRAKFLPYVEIRKMFWRSMAKTYDVDETGKMGQMEVQMMLESLGSTISEESVHGFWRKNGLDPEDEGSEILIDDLAQSLEEYLLEAEEKHVSGAAGDTSANMDDSTANSSGENKQSQSSESSSSSLSDSDDVLVDAHGVQYVKHHESSSMRLGSFEDEGPEEREEEEEVPEEKVVRLTDCPVCHYHFSKSGFSQLDIITHVATCAIHDWTTVDRVVMGNAVTEAYAQRKWFVKLISRVGYGNYSIGKNNANIIVQDRLTGQLTEERMSVYVRLGMRLIYRGMKSRAHSKTAKRILTSMTFRQGIRYDSPESKSAIVSFIKFHGLNMDEVREPLESFKSFNEFFYRKLKPEARPCECPDDKRVIVSPSDCRMMAFQTVDEATRMWIKGTEFSIGKLLHDDTNKDFTGGSLAVFRLAPQDYHRFHFPVDGVVTSIKHYPGQYYTVNPIAIRTKLDVYGENARSVVHIDSDEFGKVVMVCIGAMMVGSIMITAKEGEHQRRTDELGYFKFGGSTIVVLWQKDMIVFDEDLRENADKPLESLVRVGNKIGTGYSQ